MSRTSIDIDDRLIAEAMRVGGTKTKREAVTRALQEFVETRTRRRSLSRYAGKFELRDGYDPVKERQDRELPD